MSSRVIVAAWVEAAFPVANDTIFSGLGCEWALLVPVPSAAYAKGELVSTRNRWNLKFEPQAVLATISAEGSVDKIIFPHNTNRCAFVKPRCKLLVLLQ